MWLEKLMEDFNIKTRYELSKKTGISETTLRNIVQRETSHGRVKFDIIRALSKALDVSLDELDVKLNEYEKSTSSN